jgi:hypothetical protein
MWKSKSRHPHLAPSHQLNKHSRVRDARVKKTRKTISEDLSSALAQKKRKLHVFLIVQQKHQNATQKTSPELDILTGCQTQTSEAEFTELLTILPHFHLIHVLLALLLYIKRIFWLEGATSSASVD